MNMVWRMIENFYVTLMAKCSPQIMNAPKLTHFGDIVILEILTHFGDMDAL